jgi:hypothetical protein
MKCRVNAGRQRRLQNIHRDRIAGDVTLTATEVDCVRCLVRGRPVPGRSTETGQD